MSSLKLEHEELRLKLSGMEDNEFRQALATAKSIAGNNYDPAAKEWAFPATPDAAARLVHGIRCSPSADVLSLVRGRADSIASELAARVPSEANIQLPWADKMYPYQRGGALWMAKHKRVICADDMGLGKTVEAITASIMAKDFAGVPGNPTLVVSPNTVKAVWEAEIEKWTFARPPLVQVVDASGADRVKQVTSGADIVVVNWELLQDRLCLAPVLRKIDWGAIIADEAHRMKNRRSQQSRAMTGYRQKGNPGLRAPLMFALTGTPILNSPDELWPLLHWLDPETWSSYWRFVDLYCETTVGYNGSTIITGVKNTDALRFALRNRLMRRTKEQVALDLPAKLPKQTIEVELTPHQRKLYNEAENSMWIEVERELEKGPGPTADAIESAVREGRADRIRLLVPNAASQIVRMRQIAGSSALLGGRDESSKMDAAVELIADHPDKQFVVFTHHKRLAELMAARLRRKFKDLNAADFLHGDTPEHLRASLIERFQKGEVRTLTCTIMTGGQGITLTAADTAIFLELEWTPEYNHQARDRLHRLGQKSRVQIIEIHARGTVDTGRIVPTNRRKEAITAAILGGST